MTITRLETAAEKPDQDVIDVLEHALEMAKSGELRDIVLCGHIKGGDIFSDFLNVEMLTAVGMLEFLKFRLMEDRNKL